MDDKKSTQFSLSDLGIESKIVANFGQEVIVTTQDRLELCLIEYIKNLRSRDDWLLPFGIHLPIMLTLTTTNFKTTALGVPRSTWAALFLLGGVLTFAWALVMIVKAIRSVDTSTDAVIKKIKTPPTPP